MYVHMVRVERMRKNSESTPFARVRLVRGSLGQQNPRSSVRKKTSQCRKNKVFVFLLK